MPVSLSGFDSEQFVQFVACSRRSRLTFFLSPSLSIATLSPGHSTPLKQSQFWGSQSARVSEYVHDGTQRRPGIQCRRVIFGQSHAAMRTDGIHPKPFNVRQQSDGEPLVNRLTRESEKHRVVHWHVVGVARVRMSFSVDAEAPFWGWIRVVSRHAVEFIDLFWSVVRE